MKSYLIPVELTGVTLWDAGHVGAFSPGKKTDGTAF